MRKLIARVAGQAGMRQTLLVAATVLLVSACSTAPPPRAEPDPADASSPRTDDEPKASSSSSRPDPVSTPRPVNEKTPVRTAPAPEAPPAREPADVSGAAEPGPETGTEPATSAAPAESRPSIAPARTPAPASLDGRIVLDVSQVDDVDDDSIRDTIVYFKPVGAAPPVEPGDFEIRTQRKRLLPGVLVVPVGSTVAFPNQDDILHNVFSVSPAANFDLGLYGEGESKSHTFSEPGLAVIHCNVHHAMRADVLVVDTPFFARVDSDGRFSMEGVEAKAGELVAWHPRAGFMRRQITLPTESPLELELTLVRPRIPDHLNKSGQPYRPERPSRR